MLLVVKLLQQCCNIVGHAQQRKRWPCILPALSMRSQSCEHLVASHRPELTVPCVCSAVLLESRQSCAR
eukprot:1967817-Amphidinium_carterae.1